MGRHNAGQRQMDTFRHHEQERKANTYTARRAGKKMDSGKHDAGSLVFEHLPGDSHINDILKIWAADAGITKSVTYHVSRHTFATMLLTLGADLYTVCKLLGHSDVKTTQIYAKIINKKKEDAISLIDMIII